MDVLFSGRHDLQISFSNRDTLLPSLRKFYYRHGDLFPELSVIFPDYALRTSLGTFSILRVTLLPNGTLYTDFEPTEDAYSSGHLVLSLFETCMYMYSNIESSLSWTWKNSCYLTVYSCNARRTPVYLMWLRVAIFELVFLFMFIRVNLLCTQSKSVDI